jgi:hypothetical protein
MKKISEKFENGIKIDVYESAPVSYGYSVRVTGTRPMRENKQNVTTGRFFEVYVDSVDDYNYRGTGELLEPYMVGGYLKIQTDIIDLCSNKITGIDIGNEYVTVSTKKMKYYIKEVS